MGTQVSLHLRGHRVDTDPAIEPAVAAVFGHLRTADELFSTYRPDSQVTAIRRDELPRDQWHPWVTEVFALCEEARERTDGYFDPWRLPGGFDPSGLVKGWAVENAAAHLDRLRGYDHYLNAAWRHHRPRPHHPRPGLAGRRRRSRRPGRLSRRPRPAHRRPRDVRYGRPRRPHRRPAHRPSHQQPVVGDGHRPDPAVG